MIRLLGRATSGNVQKVIFLLEEMGLPYKREDYGRQFNNTGGDYLKLNPTGKVPTLIDGDTAIWESNTPSSAAARCGRSPVGSAILRWSPSQSRSRHTSQPTTSLGRSSTGSPRSASRQRWNTATCVSCLSAGL